MKRLSMSLICYFIVTFVAIIPQQIAKSESLVQCGGVIEGRIASNGEIQDYNVSLQAGDKLDLFLETLGNYQDLHVNVGVNAPNGFKIRELDTYFQRASDFLQTTTSAVSDTGTYKISVIGFTNTGGKYKLYITCIDNDGKVTSGGSFSQTVVCGNIIQNNFTHGNERHAYFIKMAAHDSFTISAEVKPGYQDLKLNFGVLAPNNFAIRELDTYFQRGNTTVKLEIVDLSDSGVYLITFIGFTNTGGPYTLYIGCTLSDGTVIPPSDAPPVAQPAASSGGVPPAPAFSGNGFPGLAPVDFADAVSTDLTIGQATKGKLPVGGNAVLGYTFDAKANDALALSFNRLSGNLNLGLVVLSADNKVVFQASLVTSSELTTKLTLPSDGTYTIGIFRIDLLPPASPEATAFQLTATLNP